MSEWISVKDKLPDDGQQVLAYYTGVEEIDEPPKVRTTFYFGFNNGFSCVKHYGSVSHWMPIPEPPEVDNG